MAQGNGNNEKKNENLNLKDKRWWLEQENVCKNKPDQDYELVADQTNAA